MSDAPEAMDLTKGPMAAVKTVLWVLLIIAADQLSKLWILYGLELPARESVAILPFLNFTMVWNQGISMGLPIEELTGADGLIILTGAITIWLAFWLRKSERGLERAALMAVIGGAIGNLIDRFIHGAVVDFVHLHAGGYSFYVFNLADAAISIGVVLLILDSFTAPDSSEKDTEAA